MIERPFGQSGLCCRKAILLKQFAKGEETYAVRFLFNFNEEKSDIFYAFCYDEYSRIFDLREKRGLLFIISNEKE